MPKYKNILAIDPSGNWYEGKGTTGVCFYKPSQKELTFESVSASKYNTQATYWMAHLDVIDKWRKKYNNKSFIVVIEDYLLYASKAENQINSHLETPRLIGILQNYCFLHKIPCYLEPASAVKKRWTNDILVYRGLIKKQSNCYSTVEGITINRHCLDALRHAVHFNEFKNK